MRVCRRRDGDELSCHSKNLIGNDQKWSVFGGGVDDDGDVYGGDGFGRRTIGRAGVCD